MNFWTSPSVLAIGAIVVVVLALGIAWRRYRRRPSPAERERARRLAVNQVGRLTDGVLIEAPDPPAGPAVPELLFYRYSAFGVEYTAAQDVSSLAERIPSDCCRPGTVAAVKYDPRKPSNSIVICEEWSGLSAAPQNARSH
jgi:hypothetical protein